MYSLTSARYLSIFLTCENATLGFLLGQSAAASLCGRHEEHVTKLFFLEKLCPTLNFQGKKDAQDRLKLISCVSTLNYIFQLVFRHLLYLLILSASHPIERRQGIDCLSWGKQATIRYRLPHLVLRFGRRHAYVVAATAKSWRTCKAR